MRVLRHGLVWVAVMAAGVGLPAVSQTVQAPAKPQTTVVLPPGPLLPERFGGWAQTAPVKEDKDLTQIDMPEAGVFQEDGATRVAAGSYKGAAGTVQVRAVQFGDASGAYSAFTFWASERGRSAEPRPEGETAVLPGPALLVRRGAVIVLLSGAPDAVLQGAVKALAPGLPKVDGPKAGLPLVPTLLPGHGLAVGSVRYALGPKGYAGMGGLLPTETMGFDKEAEAATGEYSVHGMRAVLTVLLYPTPQIAIQQGHAIEAAVNGSDHAKFGKTLRMRRDGTLVALAWGDVPAAAADALVKSANLHEEFSWNNAALMQVPDFGNEVHKTASLLQNIVVLSAVLGVAAILLGLFLGFGRAGIRVLLGKPAATEQEFLGINLRGIPPGALEDHAGASAPPTGPGNAA